MQPQPPPAALAAWLDTLGAGNVELDSRALQQAGTATFATTARVAAILRPGSTQEVQSCLRIATEHHVPVWPCSAGKNWGMGSRVPVVDGSVLLDLGRMNRILDFDEDMAYITVEPGVTFGQVHAFLRARSSRLFCAVIGGSAQASLIGNALERGDGVGPYRNRAEHASAMEVVLPTGERIQTGLGRWSDACSVHLHRAGVGPGLDGLFLQSNLGVVTRMTFWLAPRPAFMQLFSLSIQDCEQLAGVLDAVRRLSQSGVMGESGFTFWNRYKLLARSGQYPWGQVGEKTPLGAAAAGSPSWYGNGAQYLASRAIGHAARTLVCQALEPFARIVVADTDTHGAELENSTFFGVPGDDNVASTYWRKRTPPPPGQMDPDRDGCGVLWVCPVLPLQGALVAQLLPQLEALVLAHGFEPNLGMHVSDARCLLAYAAIMYDRNVPGEDARARACHDALFARLLSQGHYPFRLSLPAMSQLPPPADATGRLMDALKQVLDPALVLAPGRYAMHSHEGCH
jgi:4-cresol dehydrogenase (hydroxylating)